MSAPSFASPVYIAARAWGLGWPVGLTVLSMLLGVTSAVVLMVGVLVVACGCVDGLTGRIPNRLVLMALATVVLGVTLSPLLGHRSTSDVAAAASVGLVLGGAPVVFVIWLVRPDLIGGGDWKLLSVASAGVGAIAPLLAVVMTLVACIIQFLRLARQRRRSLAFGPSIAVGFVGALCLVPWLERYGGLAP